MKIAPGDIFQDQVVATAIDPAIVDRHDVWMLERFGAPGLPHETLQQSRVPRQRAGQNLERDLVPVSSWTARKTELIPPDPSGWRTR